MSDENEPVLEPILRWFRFRQGIRQFDRKRPLTIVDLGCGPTYPFYFFMKKRGIKIVSYIGVDPLGKSAGDGGETAIQVIKEKLEEKISLPDGYADYMVGLAVLEHVDNPAGLIKESLRVLKPSGRAIFTCPAARAKGVLEFLAWRLGWVSKREIAEHKQYFNKQELMEMAEELSGVKNIKHRYFELGFNNLLVLEKA